MRAAPSLPWAAAAQGPVTSVALRVLHLAAGLAASGLLLAVIVPVSGKQPIVVFALLFVCAGATWMALTVRYEYSLAVLALYLGLLDGFLKLKLDNQAAVLGRDVLFYAIVAGALARFAVSGRRVSWPPMSGWLLALLVVVLVQLWNPGNGSWAHSVSALRPHLEWLPLFFFGYVAMRSNRRLRGFLAVLLVVGAVNGAVSLVQYNLTADQFAAWGPGYAAKVTGEGGSVSPRTFSDAEGNSRIRPFGLGSDIPFGGICGLIGLSAGIGLIAASRPQAILVVAPLLAMNVVAIVTSQSRTVIVSAAVLLIGFALLTTVSRQRATRIIAMAVGLAVVVTIGLALINSSKTTNRYANIAPDRAVGTVIKERRGTYSDLPRLLAHFPFGAGIGTVGPAAAEFGGPGNKGLSGESQFNFLLLEVGIPGLIVFTLFQLRVVGLALRRLRRVEDPQSRLLLAACAAPLIGFVANWITGVTTVSTPNSPYFYFIAGVLAWWLITALSPRHAVGEHPLVAS